MNITVIISPVHDCLNPVSIEPEGRRIDHSCIRWVLSKYDSVALEEALHLRNKMTDSRVTVIGIAPSRSEVVFRECLAVGADEAIRIWDEALGGSDSYVYASALAEALNILTFDLLLSGWKSSDLEHGQMRPILAELLAVPQVTSVRKVLYMQDDNRITVIKRTPGYLTKLSCTLPAMVTMEKGQPLRYPKYPDRRRANRIPIPVWDKKMIGLSESSLGRSASLTVVERFTPPKPTKRYSIAASVGSMSTVARLNQIMSGGLQNQKESKIWECRDKSSLDKIIDYILKERMVDL